MTKIKGLIYNLQSVVSFMAAWSDDIKSRILSLTLVKHYPASVPDLSLQSKLDKLPKCQANG